MSNLIIANEIAGGAVYGVAQFDYTVAGDPGQDYAAALAAASFRQSVAIEDTAAAYSEVVRQRERKVSDLGEVLAALAKAIATMDPKSQDTGKKSELSEELADAHSLAGKYGLAFGWAEYKDGKMSITYRDATKAQNNIQYEMDKEDNNLHQDMVALQGYISKRDNAFTNAAKVVQKAVRTGSGTVRNMT